jgi:hypothetical protein
MLGVLPGRIVHLANFAGWGLLNNGVPVDAAQRPVNCPNPTPTTTAAK